MSSPLPNLYPLDYTGLVSSNLIVREPVDLSDQADQKFRFFSPLYSPYFKKNVVVTDTVTGLVLLPTQYRCYQLAATPTALAGAGNDTYSVVVIGDPRISDFLTVSYQTVGGGYTTGYEAITSMVNNLLQNLQADNTQPIDWTDINNLPEGFPQSLHLHSLGQTVGWEYMSSQLEQLRMAIILGDHVTKSIVLGYLDQAIASATAAQLNTLGSGTPFALHVNDTNNPHNVTTAQLGLDLVQNYPVATDEEAFAGTATDRYLTVAKMSAAIRNRINSGIDAHIPLRTNPHETTASQVGLGNVRNFGIASAADLTNAIDGVEKYVTNKSLGAYLTNYFASQFGTQQGTLASVTQSANDALNAANAAKLAADAAFELTTNSLTNIDAATALAEDAFSISNQNSVSALNSQAAAETLVQTYAAQAILNAQAVGYAQGFADGQATG